MEGRISQGSSRSDDLVNHAQRWRDAGATHVSVNTMGSGLSGLDANVQALAIAADALQLTR